MNFIEKKKRVRESWAYQKHNSQDIGEYPESYFRNQLILTLFVPFEERKDPNLSNLLLVVESLFDWLIWDISNPWY